jgi:hypothetical protein
MSISVSSIGKSIACGVSTIALSLGLASPGLANPVLPGLTNLNFTQLTHTPKCSFSNCGLTGWSGGNGLIFIDSQTGGGSAAGIPTNHEYLTTYGNPVGAITGNYVEADGNPTFESSFNYTVAGLTPGTTYSLAFFQGASQQTGFSGPTSNQWIVSLGTSAGGLTINCVGPVCAYSEPGASIATSPLMTVPSEGTVGWTPVSVNLTATSTTEVLSFLAWADNGNTANLPPIAFLSGVDSPAILSSTGSTPAPAALPLFAIGLAGLGGLLLRRRAKLATAN